MSKDTLESLRKERDDWKKKYDAILEPIANLGVRYNDLSKKFDELSARINPSDGYISREEHEECIAALKDTHENEKDTILRQGRKIHFENVALKQEVRSAFSTLFGILAANDIPQRRIDAIRHELQRDIPSYYVGLSER